MGIFYKDCPHCATTHAASTDMCGCGYLFNGEKLEEPHQVPALVAQEEKLYEAYLAARLEQAVVEAQQAQISARTGPKTPQSIAQAEEAVKETVKALAQAKVDFDTQTAKTAEAVKMAEIATTTLAIKQRSTGKTVCAVSSASALPIQKTHHSVAPLEKAEKRAHTPVKGKSKKSHATDPHRLQAKQADRARRQAEQARNEAEKVKRIEEERTEADATRKAEESKIQAEHLRQAERAREAEKVKRAEEARVQTENTRKTEHAKLQVQQLRQAERARGAAEKIKRAEAAQILAEQARQTEEARMRAAKVKETEHAAARAYLTAQTAKAEQVLKTAQASKIREQALAQGGFKAAQAARAAQIMLSPKECPNCTGAVPHHRNQCGCGYTFTAGENELPGLSLSPTETKELFSSISNKSNP